MAKSPDSPDNVFSEWVTLPDGRRIRVMAYDDGSIRFRVEGTPYVLTEAFLSGSSADTAILKLSPGKAGSAAYRNRVAGAAAEGDTDE
ncbi:hypothetical protein [Streptomyces sp. NPDC048002]|uniref:hypothetical protein n=1 Tax=unclassified Streptomyces TaxID=2593676 RepID=UPI0034038991